MVALGLFALVCVLGVLVSTRVGGKRVGRFELNELHRSTSISAMVFLAIHIATNVIDTYVSIHWQSIVLPLTSSYRRIPVSLGTLAFDVMITLWITSLVKEKIPFRVWRGLHWGSYLAFVGSVAHAYLSGTDSTTTWGVSVILATAGLVLAAGLWRFIARPERAAGRTALSPMPKDAK
jgi:DMSO/TMAO reductase YedYZ heme-binding membrane subunit